MNDTDRIQLLQRAILDNVAYGIISTTPDGTVTSFNPAAERLLGYAADEIIGKQTPAIWHDPEEIARHAMQLSKELNETIAPGFDVFAARPRRRLPEEGEWTFVRKDGGRIPVNLSVTALWDEAGHITGFVGLIYDLSERQHMENALRFVAQRGWQTCGENFFDALAQFLGEELGMDYVLIDRLDENPEIAETVALYSRGTIATNMRYALKGTPCANVMGRGLCIYRHGIQQLFPDDPLLPGMGAESYIGIPLWDSTGQPIGLIAVMGTRPLSDDAPVTQLLQLVAIRAAAELERERSDRLLRAREHEFRTLAASLPDNIVRHDREGRVIYVSPVLEKTLGADAARMLGKTIREMYPDGRFEVGAQEVDAALASGENREFEFTMPIPGKEPIVHQIRTVVERDEQGKVSGALSIARDVTERKRAEERLQRTARELAEAQRIAHLGNWNLDLVNNVLTWSDETFRIFEIDQTEFGASYEAFLNSIHPDDRDMVNHAYTESVRCRVPYDIVHRLRMEDGRIKYVNERCETFYSDDGTPLRSAGTVHDITDRRQAEDEIRKLNEQLEARVAERTAQLEASNKELEDFAYSVSHDLRAPLRAIDGYRGLLEKRIASILDEESRRYLESISQSATRMGRLIDDLLAFSRIGRFELERQPVKLDALANEVIKELANEESDREMLWHITELPPVTGDRAMLRMVLQNLIGNAVKFTRTRATAEITIGSREEKDEIVVFISDNGVGFDMQYVDKLFGIFQRLHGVDEFEGTGIGLANVRRIIARHGGRTWAEGKVDGGATFYFTLPRS